MAKFSKGHYELIARNIKRGLDYSNKEFGGMNQHKYEALQHLAVDLANEFHNDNPMFDEVRFLKACGF